MKKVGFIGGFDKTDFILYVAKLLTIAGNKVLVVDTSLLQKTRYVVPNIGSTMSYITEYQDLDVAIGFYSLEDIADYLGKNNEQELGYDYVLIDIDSYNAIRNFEINNETKNYFVTSFDVYSIKKGLEAISNLNEPLSLTKIIFSRQVSKSENEYLEYLAMGSKIEWNQYKIYFPLESGDQSAIIDNQKVSKIKFVNLSNQYRESLIFVVEDILGDVNSGRLKKLMKSVE